jgi:hypothetical protein
VLWCSFCSRFFFSSTSLKLVLIQLVDINQVLKCEDEADGIGLRKFGGNVFSRGVLHFFHMLRVSIHSVSHSAFATKDIKKNTIHTEFRIMHKEQSS